MTLTGRERHRPGGGEAMTPGYRIEGSEGLTDSPVDLPAPVVGSVPRVQVGARGTDHLTSPDAPVWGVVADPTWTVVQGPGVLAVAFGCHLVPRPVAEVADTWRFPTALVCPILTAAERAGVDVRLKRPSSGLDVITGPLGGNVLLPVVPESAPDVVREGLLRRRTTAHGHPCPCGASTTTDAIGRAIETRHAGDCPAEESVLRAAAQSWLGV